METWLTLFLSCQFRICLLLLIAVWRVCFVSSFTALLKYLYWILHTCCTLYLKCNFLTSVNLSNKCVGKKRHLTLTVPTVSYTHPLSLWVKSRICARCDRLFYRTYEWQSVCSDLSLNKIIKSNCFPLCKTERHNKISCQQSCIHQILFLTKPSELPAGLSVRGSSGTPWGVGGTVTVQMFQRLRFIAHTHARTHTVLSGTAPV